MIRPCHQAQDMRQHQTDKPHDAGNAYATRSKQCCKDDEHAGGSRGIYAQHAGILFTEQHNVERAREQHAERRAGQDEQRCKTHFSNDAAEKLPSVQNTTCSMLSRCRIMIPEVSAVNNEDTATPESKSAEAEVRLPTRANCVTSITARTPPKRAQTATLPSPSAAIPKEAPPIPSAMQAAAPKPAPALTPRIWLSAIGF